MPAETLTPEEEAEFAEALAEIADELREMEARVAALEAERAAKVADAPPVIRALAASLEEDESGG